MASKLRQDVEERFGSAVASDEKLLSECTFLPYLHDLRELTRFSGVNICQMFNMSPETLYYKWEAHSFNNTRSIHVLTTETIVSLKASIQRELTAENSKKQKARANLPAFSRGHSLAARYNQLRNATIPSATAGIGTDLRGDDLRGVGRSDEMVLDGPKINVVSNKTRACKSLVICLLAFYISSQIATCMRNLR
jgi:DNA polymerase alpha subunit B